MKPLFIARSYPPSTGGMERFSDNLAIELARMGPTMTIANRGGKRALPLFVPQAILAATLAARRGRCDLIHLSDGLLAPAGALLKKTTGLPVSATVHGLDLTFDNAAYQAMLSRTLVKLDRLIAVSESTRQICIERWPQLRSKMVVVPNGVNTDVEFGPPRDLPIDIAAAVHGKRMILTVGRLVERKGVAWFIQHALPLLPEDVVYLVAGEGPERDAIQRAVTLAGLGGRVRLLGRVTDRTLQALYSHADVFVMPNVVVDNDVEGFGLVALEAAIRALPVVASELQGIPEAIHDGANGFLVPPADAQAFVVKLEEVLDLTPRRRHNLGVRFQKYTQATFSWRRTAEAYWHEFERLANKDNIAAVVTGPALSKTF